MSDSRQSVPWYAPGDVRATVERGVADDVPTTEIAEYLAEREFDDIPLSRVERIVDRMPLDEDTGPTEADLSQPEATDAHPRESTSNQLAVTDLEYVSNREAARLLGLALEQFDGNTVRPPETAQVETDLVWHRQHGSVAIRMVPTPSGTVDTDHVHALLDGTVVPEGVRSPSELAIVTNRTFTDEALEVAGDHDIRCYDAGHVEEWLRRARIPMDAVGTLLEEGESHDGPLADLVEVPPIPAPRKQVDPLEISRAFDIDSLTTPADEESTAATVERTATDEERQTTGLDRSTARDDPLNGTQPTAGETGTLYADPDEDGDFDAFDRFVDGIEDDPQESNPDSDDRSADGTDVSQRGNGENTGSAATRREQLLADLAKAIEDGSDLNTYNAVQAHGSYPVESYEEEFGSLKNAVDTVEADHSGGTQ